MGLFGTDGIRGKPGESPLSPREIQRIGSSYAKILGKNPKLILAMDTRKGGPKIKEKLLTGLLNCGAHVHDVGILSSPAAAFLAKKEKMDGAVIVTASHNPASDNGIKFFGGDGKKLPISTELRIEKEYFSGKERKPAKGKLVDGAVLIESYVDFLSSKFKNIGIKVVVDCANGAAYRTAPQIFANSGLKTTFTSISPDGLNINEDCGSEHPENLSGLVKKNKAQAGIALDGDADRVLFCDENGKILTGDEMIGIIAISMKKKSLLKNNTVIVTHYSNFGLEKSLEKHKIKVKRSDVGDRAVSDMMEKTNANLGGEQSGHMIISDLMPTGDGILSALMVLQVMKDERKKLSELTSQIQRFPQVMMVVEVKEKKPYPLLEKKIKQVDAMLQGEGRVFVRYSGTQKLLRIMVEGKSENKINKTAKELVKSAKVELS